MRELVKYHCHWIERFAHKCISINYSRWTFIDSIPGKSTIVCWNYFEIRSDLNYILNVKPFRATSSILYLYRLIYLGMPRISRIASEGFAFHCRIWSQRLVSLSIPNNQVRRLLWLCISVCWSHGPTIICWLDCRMHETTWPSHKSKLNNGHKSTALHAAALMTARSLTSTQRVAEAWQQRVYRSFQLPAMEAAPVFNLHSLARSTLKPSLDGPLSALNNFPHKPSHKSKLNSGHKSTAPRAAASNMAQSLTSTQRVA